MITVFEFKALHLLGGHSPTWTIPSAFFGFFSYFLEMPHIFSQISPEAVILQCMPTTQQGSRMCLTMPGLCVEMESL
jgi:hypothetical protein